MLKPHMTPETLDRCKLTRLLAKT